MKIRKICKWVMPFSVLCFLVSCSAQTQENSTSKEVFQYKAQSEWVEDLSEEQYHILIDQGTEAPFTGKFNEWKKNGKFYCIGCQNALFSSEHKFDSGTGWPSFYQSLCDTSTLLKSDSKHGMSRVEVVCFRCKGHLGHVFNDGPKPTGKRFCINSEVLYFK